MREHYELCEICQKREGKYLCEFEGEHKNKNICKKCWNEIASNDETFQKETNLLNKRLDWGVNWHILFSVYILIISISLHLNVARDFKDILAIFSDNHQIIYFVLLSLLSFVINKLIEVVTSVMPKWLKILLEILFTCLCTFVGMVLLLKKDLTFNWEESLLTYCVPVILIGDIVLVILHRLKKNQKIKIWVASMVLCVIVLLVALFDFIFFQ